VALPWRFELTHPVPASVLVQAVEGGPEGGGKGCIDDYCGNVATEHTVVCYGNRACGRGLEGEPEHQGWQGT